MNKKILYVAGCASVLFVCAIFIKLFAAQKMDKKLHLITVLYNETNSKRMEEYKTCLQNNLNNPAIGSIHVIYDTAKDDGTNTLLTFLKQQPITISYVNERPSFAHCFATANSTLPIGAKVIVSNADIYFNDTLDLLENYDLGGKFLAITRKEVNADGTISYMRGTPHKGQKEASQDVWIFQTPFPDFKQRDDILLGTLHCESEVAYHAQQLGLEVLNPYFSIDCLHLHLSGIRHWVDRPYPKKDVFMTTLDELK